MADGRALSVFARAGAPGDGLPARVAGDYGSSRLLVPLRDGALFAAVRGRGRMCLLAVPWHGLAATTCTDRAAFLRRGMTLALPPVGAPPVANLAGARWTPDGVVTYWTRAEGES